MGDERCRYTYDDVIYPDRGKTCCWRPVYDDTGRCVWHVDDAVKSKSDLESSRPAADERIDGAILNGMMLEGAEWFSDRSFIGADFDDADVGHADFEGADLRKSSFRGARAPDAAFTGANLEDADFTKSDLTGADLRKARLDRTDLSASSMNGGTTFGRRAVYEDEMRAVDGTRERRNELEAAIRTYRTIERVSETNTLYGQASQFYRRAKDARRQYNWLEKNYHAAALGEASRRFTGYGNQPWRVILTSIGVMAGLGLLYPLLGGLRELGAGDPTVYALDLSLRGSVGHGATVVLKGIYFSVVTFTTLGYGNLVPVSELGRYIAAFEAVLGSLLTAIFVAVLTRSTWLR